MPPRIVETPRLFAVYSTGDARDPSPGLPPRKFFGSGSCERFSHFAVSRCYRDVLSFISGDDVIKCRPHLLQELLEPPELILEGLTQGGVSRGLLKKFSDLAHRQGSLKKGEHTKINTNQPYIHTRYQVACLV